MYDLKLRGDCDTSVARIQLMKTEHPSACVTVNGKVCIACSSELCECVSC
jgi:hypothetical protein